MERMRSFLRTTPIFYLCIIICFFGCAATNSDSRLQENSKEIKCDSLRAKFQLTMEVDGKSQELDAVLFSVPKKRYRLELTGALGIGVASLLWQESGWQIVFPTEKQYIKGAGYKVGLLQDSSIPSVNIHQIANIFNGILLPEDFEKKSERDSLGTHIIEAREKAGANFVYAIQNDKIIWLSRNGNNGEKETLRFFDFKNFSSLQIPENIVFERGEKWYLSIRVKKITREKEFSRGVWRLNIPKSYKLMGE